ncbi:hypothetical protein BJ742DRAFT_808640 [Cladochytrium replicatum]|nr:hypothetical protein BJ742DRAFT_808640 [Cladochytrium replicatum]
MASEFAISATLVGTINPDEPIWVVDRHANDSRSISLRTPNSSVDALYTIRYSNMKEAHIFSGKYSRQVSENRQVARVVAMDTDWIGYTVYTKSDPSASSPEVLNVVATANGKGAVQFVCNQASFLFVPEAFSSRNDFRFIAHCGKQDSGNEILLASVVAFTCFIGDDILDQVLNVHHGDIERLQKANPKGGENTRPKHKGNIVGKAIEVLAMNIAQGGSG